MIVPYGIQTYKRADLPKVRLSNLYVEATPASRAQTALLSRPSLQIEYDIGAGPIRGMYGQPGALGGALFAVSGDTLYKAVDDLGTIPGTARVSIAASSSQMLIANDTALYVSDGVTVDTVAFPDDAGVTSVAYINGYFLAARADSQRFYWSGILDAESWDALDYASAERAPDSLVAIWIVSDQIWLFGEITTEVWVTTGDGEVPFQRIDGRLYDQGCISRDTIAKLDNSIYWVGHDFKVYRGDTIPMRVSDHGIEEAIQSSDPADLTAWAFPWQGNLFYVLSTSSGTFAYNAASQQWSEFGSYQRNNWRAHVGVFLNDTVYAGDDQTGRIWKLNGDILLDGTDPIERRWTALFPTALFLDNLSLDVPVGEAPVLDFDPITEVRISRDGGNTYGEWQQAAVGEQGQYRKRPAWRRLGMIDGEGGLLDFRMTDPTYWRVSSIRFNEAMGGRSRV